MYYEFRTLPYTELSTAGLGLLAGMLAVLLAKKRFAVVASRATGVGLLILWLLVPYVKNLFWPATPVHFHDEWNQEVCIQSIGSSCGPAAAATLLRAAGVSVTEAELAQDSYTSLSGTEIWYLARTLRKHGFATRYFFTRPDPETLPTPALAGTRLGGPGGAGHFIALLDATTAGYHVGDSLVGPVALPAHDYRPYHFTGCFLLVERVKTNN